MDEVLLFERCLTFEKWTGKIYRPFASVYQDFFDVQIGDSNRNHHWVVLLGIDSREVGIYEHYWRDWSFSTCNMLYALMAHKCLFQADLVLPLLAKSLAIVLITSCLPPSLTTEVLTWSDLASIFSCFLFICSIDVQQCVVVVLR